MAGPNLLAHILVSKFDDHLPLYRQHEIFARMGSDIPETTLDGWCGRAMKTLSPLLERIEADIMSGNLLHADDTPIRVLDPSLRDKVRQPPKCKQAMLSQMGRYRIDGLCLEHLRVTRQLRRRGRHKGRPLLAVSVAQDAACGDVAASRCAERVAVEACRACIERAIGTCDVERINPRRDRA